jgi:hypothetical protein
VGVSVLSLI